MPRIKLDKKCGLMWIIICITLYGLRLIDKNFNQGNKAVKRGIKRAKLLVDNKADVKATDEVNLRVLSLTHTSSMFPRCCRIAGTPLCR